jgi:regulatory protein
MRRDSRRGPPRPLDERGLERAALNYVKRFPTTVVNLDRVLARRIARAEREQGGLSDEARASLERCRERMITQLTAAGLVDDAAFARGLASSLKRQGMPRFRIAQKLRDKGVGDIDRDAALALLEEEEDAPDKVAAWNLARRRRLGPYRVDDEQRQARREKDLGVLARAGFPFGLAKQVIDGDLDDAPAER